MWQKSRLGNTPQFIPPPAHDFQSPFESTLMVDSFLSSIFRLIFDRAFSRAIDCKLHIYTVMCCSYSINSLTNLQLMECDTGEPENSSEKGEVGHSWGTSREPVPPAEDICSRGKVSVKEEHKYLIPVIEGNAKVSHTL